MCQLTLIDIDEEISSSFIPQMLTVTNVFENNVDGFGYSSFDSVDITKTNTNALDWWLDDKNSVKNINGIYHVRRSSYKNTESKQFHAHPFRFNNIILVHNGTLSGIKQLKDYADVVGKYSKEDYIDSQMFTRVLADKVGKGKVTLGKLNEALHYFSGPFAFLIRDLNTKKKVWIVKDDKKSLFQAVITLNEKPVGIVINTLDDALFMLKVYLQSKFPKINVVISQIPKTSVHEYKVGDYILQESVGTPVIGIAPAVRQSTYLPARSPVNTYVDLYGEFIDSVFRLELQISEILVLCEFLFEKSLFTLKETELELFSELLINIDADNNFASRRALWSSIKSLFPKKSILNLYILTGAKFPYLLNTRAELMRIEEDAKLDNGWAADELYSIH